MSLNVNLNHSRSRRSSRRTVLLAASVVAAAPLAGCGDDRPARVPVSGRVLIDGKPLESGNIRFHASNHRAATGAIGPQGKFQLSTYELGDGCVRGTHHVTVTAVEVINANTERWLAPKKYSKPTSSGLTFAVTQPTDAAEIHLTWGKSSTGQRASGGAD